MESNTAMPGLGVGLLARLPLAPERPWIGHSAAVFLSLAALASRHAVAGWLPPGFPFLTFFPAVMLTLVFSSLRSGLAVGVACGVIAAS